jgi:predicted TPR repeat methyltransferase
MLAEQVSLCYKVYIARPLIQCHMIGLISKELIPHVKSILGVDISQGMVNQFNLRVQNESISPDKMHAVREELEGKEGELDGMKFDVIVVRNICFPYGWILTLTFFFSARQHTTILSLLNR